MTFTTKFDQFVCEGDTITCEKDGFDVAARIERDTDANIDYGNPDTVCSEKQHTKLLEARAAWLNDKWFYCGIVLSISLNGFELDTNTASLWGVEANYPDSNNGYLTEVANDLLDEAVEAGKSARESVLVQLRR